MVTTKEYRHFKSLNRLARIGFLGLAFHLSLLVVSNAAARQMELHAAVQSGSVAVRIEFLGGAMGDRMKVFLRNRTTEPMFLSVTEGTVFLPQGGDVQRLAALRLKGKLTAKGTYQRTQIIELVDATEQGFLIEVVCIDYHKNSPPAGQSFIIGAVDPRCQRILSARGDLTLWAYQSAIWMDRAGVPAQKLQATFKVPNVDIQAAKDLLVQAEQIGVASLEKVEVSASARTTAQGVFSADPAVRVDAYSKIQSLDPTDRAKLEVILNLNLPGGGRLPTPEELQAGSTLESLLPAGIALPVLEIPESVDEIMVMVESIRRFSESTQSDDSREEIGKRITTALRLAPHLAGLKARLPVVRIAATQGLANFRHPIAVEALLLALSDDDQRVRNAASVGLEKLTKQTLGANKEAWIQWWQMSHTSFAIEVESK
jgi:hypothetical protein